MSDLLAAAAQALGAPEAIVKRSAEARAKASGVSVDEVLQAWAGGQAAPVVESSAGPQPSEAPAGAGEAPAAAAPEEEPAAAPTQPEPVTAGAVSEPEPVTAGAVAVATVPAKPPILEGRTDHPFAVMLGAVGLFLLTVLVGWVAPSVADEDDQVLTSAIAYSEAARQGRAVYLSEGCAACHTQQVRPIVADAGLGGVTLADSNQVIGNRRYGPDLAHIGSRVEDDAALVQVLSGQDGHPSYDHIGDEQLAALVAYLLETK